VGGGGCLSGRDVGEVWFGNLGRQMTQFGPPMSTQTWHLLQQSKKTCGHNNVPRGLNFNQQDTDTCVGCSRDSQKLLVAVFVSRNVGIHFPRVIFRTLYDAGGHSFCFGIKNNLCKKKNKPQLLLSTNGQYKLHPSINYPNYKTITKW
jgi:hypothetical protein